MSSSSRILRAGGRGTASPTTTTTEAAAVAIAVAAARPASDAGDRAAPVIRGNLVRHRDDRPPATGAGRDSGDGSGNPAGRGTLAATVAWALAPRGPVGKTQPGMVPSSGATPAADAPPIDLLQAQRIADQRGYAAGHARATAELQAAIESAAAFAVRLEAVAPGRTTAVARAIGDIAIAVARRIVGAELRTDPSLLVHSIEAAVGMINGSPEARVILHPAAVEPVRAAWEAAHGTAHLGKRWTFEADDASAPGDCVLRFDHGFVDAGIEAQLAEIERAIDAAVPGLWSGQPANGDSLPSDRRLPERTR